MKRLATLVTIVLFSACSTKDEKPPKTRPAAGPTMVANPHPTTMTPTPTPTVSQSAEASPTPTSVECYIICHGGNLELCLPKQGADAHIEHHPEDSWGECVDPD